MDKNQSFFRLHPDKVLSSIEDEGYITTGEFYQLNSYENRVFDILLEEGTHKLHNNHVIAKFYRPNRWSLEAIKEEHQFLFELKEQDIPVVAPIKFRDGASIAISDDMYFCLFPKTLGRMPQEFLADQLYTIGRLLAQLHNVGSKKNFIHRPTMGDEKHLGWIALDLLKNWVADELWTRYEEAGDQILDFLDEYLDPMQFLRIHGDAHKGNLLSNDEHFFMVDFDDTINGPAVQDFWMLLSGDTNESQYEIEQILKGYEELRLFNDNELKLIPALRGLRILSYAAWIAARWKDPSFPKIFPEFNTYNYWAEETEALERIAWTL